VALIILTIQILKLIKKITLLREELMCMYIYINSFMIEYLINFFFVFSIIDCMLNYSF